MSSQSNVVTAITQAVTAMPALSVFQDEYRWTLVAGIVVAFLLSFGMGANDVANAFGTSVGSKALTLIRAYILATIFESMGAILIGSQVIDTIRKSIVDVGIYEDEPQVLLLGQIATLGGCALWLLLATIAQLPISTTHSVIGASMGFTLMCHGFKGVKWMTIVTIICSWFVSPILAGISAVALYLLVDHSILRRRNPMIAGLRLLPVFYFVCVLFNAFMVLFEGSQITSILAMTVIPDLKHIPLWAVILVSIIIASLAAVIVHFLYVPRLKKKLELIPHDELVVVQSVETEKSTSMEKSTRDTTVASAPTTPKTVRRSPQPNQPNSPFGGGLQKAMSWLLPDRTRTDSEQTLIMFNSIQIMTACFAGFAHGANDISNSIAPLTALVSIYNDRDVNQTAKTPVYVVAYGVMGICIGLWVLGHKVILTVGTNMTAINPATGFCIEFGSALTVMFASKLGLPVSTTHCLIGAVAATGLLMNKKSLNKKIMRNIALSWVVTLPISGVFSAIIMLVLKWTML